jgi:biotin carboxyl carrier protein
VKYEIQIGKMQRTVQIEPLPGGAFSVQLEGRPVAVDAVETSPSTYSILLDGFAQEARVSEDGEGLLVRCAGAEFSVRVRDPRSWRGSQHSVLQAEGPQRILAPMPGKVVRVLVNVGDQVEIGCGLIVVEAMKMQNEIRAPKSGRIEGILVGEGQTVRSQEALVVIV